MREWLAELRTLNANLAALIDVLQDLRDMLGLRWGIRVKEKGDG